MNLLLRLAYFAIIYGLLSATSPANTAAPYFHIAGPNGETSEELLPLKSSSAKVTIDGPIARVRLSQRYGNSGTKPIEAIYIFPASTGAAVHGMTLSTGGRVITARIHESKQARTEYETAKTEHKTAALLEEHRPNVFQMSVANLLPGDDVMIEVQWSETIKALDSVYEYVFPTVVGPRYTGRGNDGDTPAWTANPYLREGSPNPATLSLDVNLSTPLDLTDVSSPSHPLKVDFKSKHEASATIETREGEDAANRDFILRWKLAGNQVNAGLLLHQGGSENHFLLQIEPPQRATPSQVPPRDYIMVLDVSGSMAGFPLDTAKLLLRDLVKGLKPHDTFNVVCFASGNGILSDTPLPAEEGNLDKAIRFINGQNAGGGTELAAGLRRALNLPGGSDRSRSILLVTDGFISADNEVRDMIRSHIGSANLFTFGIGSSVNRELIEAIARAGAGEPTVVTTTGEAAPAAARFLSFVSNPVLAKVRIEGEGIELGDITPFPIADVFAARPLTITGKWNGKPHGTITVRGIGGNGTAFEKRFDIAEAAEARGLNHPGLPILWARERVRGLSETITADHDTISEITRLGLGYSLMTPYTSFVAVDATPRNFAGNAMQVKQPLPLPLGVTEAAIGGSGGGALVTNASVPEPGAIGLIALLVVLLAAQRNR